MKDGFKTNNIFFAAVLSYLGYSLLTVDLLDQRTTQWGYDIESFDAATLQEQYDSPTGLALSSVKSFVYAYNGLARQIRDMRRDDQTSWASESWVAGAGR